MLKRKLKNSLTNRRGGAFNGGGAFDGTRDLGQKFNAPCSFGKPIDVHGLPSQQSARVRNWRDTICVFVREKVESFTV